MYDTKNQNFFLNQIYIELKVFYDVLILIVFLLLVSLIWQTLVWHCEEEREIHTILLYVVKDDCAR